MNILTIGSKTSNEKISIESMNTIELDIYTDEDRNGDLEECINSLGGTFTVTATITAEEVRKAAGFEDVADYIIATFGEVLATTIQDTDSTYGDIEWDSAVNEIVIEDIVDVCCDEKIQINEDGSATVVWISDVAERAISERVEG